MSIAMVDGTELHYDDIIGPEAGADPTVIVWLHGFLFSADLYATIIEKLPRYRHIAFDLRGHGHSADVVDDPSLSRMAEDCWSILRQLGINRFVTVGHSMGNAVGMRLVSGHPEAAIAGVSLAGVPLTGMPASTREGNLGLPALGGDAAAMSDMLAALFVHPGMEEVVKQGGAAAALVKPGPLTAIGLTELYRDDAATILPGLTQPWLFVIPVDDAAIPADAQEATARAVPGARTLLLSGEGHIHPQERPDETAAYIEAFLRTRL